MDHEPSEEELERRLKSLLGAGEQDDEPEEDPVEGSFKKIDAKVAETHAAAEKSKEVIDAEFDARLKALEEKAQRAREKKDTEKKREIKQRESSQEDSRALGLGLSIAYIIVGVPLMGAAAGWFIDKQMGTHTWMGILTLIGATFGVIVAVMKVNQSGINR